MIGVTTVCYEFVYLAMVASQLRLYFFAAAQVAWLISLSLTERMCEFLSSYSSCLRSRRGLWEKYYHASFDLMYYFSSDVGFTNIVVWNMEQFGAETK